MIPLNNKSNRNGQEFTGKKSNYELKINDIGRLNSNRDVFDYGS